ncbi:MAG: hypothetical protein ACK5VS_07180, partial [Hyphomonadaceae bacterium]
GGAEEAQPAKTKAAQANRMRFFILIPPESPKATASRMAETGYKTENGSRYKKEAKISGYKQG